MAEVSRERCERLASELTALSEPERPHAIRALADQAAAEGDPLLFNLTALVIRDRMDWDLAESLFAVGAGLPGPSGRPMALFEGAVTASLKGDPTRAAAMLAELEAETPLTGYHQLIYAHQLGRTGHVAEASARLEQARRLDPRLERECVEFRQFFDYLQHFPLEEAQARRAALLESFPFQGPRQVADAALAALAEGRGYSMIRLNDGEGALLHLSIDDEAAFSALYDRNRREFHRQWFFGHEDRLYDPDFLAAVQEFNDIIANADCLGAYHLTLDGEYAWGSIRNVPCLFNVFRKLEALRDGEPASVGRIALADPLINRQLLSHGELERLLASQTRIGLISCHAGLPDALAARFGLADVIFHQTPGEAGVTRGVESEPFQAWHSRLKAELAQVSPGTLYLVGAGVMGKIYCDLIKHGGGVALDIGAVADIWMKAPTRHFGSDDLRHAIA